MDDDAVKAPAIQGPDVWNWPSRLLALFRRGRPNRRCRFLGGLCCKTWLVSIWLLILGIAGFVG